MKVIRNWVFMLGVFVVLGTSLTACNTIKGIGEDARALGGAVSDAASDNKGY